LKFDAASALSMLYVAQSKGVGVQQRRDATGTIYAAGAVLIVNGPIQLNLGHTALGWLSIGMGVLLIVQRFLRNRKRPDA
jgi:hypothetical protein